MDCVSPSTVDRTTWRCMSCGYDLRGSIGAACCPECGERLDRIRPLWTPARRAWVGTEVAALSLLAITNFLTLGPASIGGVLPHRVAEIYIALWGVTFAIGVVSLVWQTRLSRIPLSMVVTSLLILIIATLAAAINAFAWIIILSSV